jgi:hypothetical protein
MPNYVIRHKGKIPLNTDGQALEFDFQELFYGVYTSNRRLMIYNAEGTTFSTSSIVGVTSSQVIGMARSPSGELLVNSLIGTYSYIQTSTNNGSTWTAVTLTQSAGAYIWSKQYNKFVGGRRQPSTPTPPYPGIYTNDIIEISEWGLMFCASTEPFGACYKSTDGGQTWVSFTSSHPQFGTVAVYGHSFAYNGTTLICSGFSTLGVFYTTDGLNWNCTTNSVTSPISVTWHQFTNRFYGVIQNAYVYSSVSGLDFTIASPAIGGSLNDIQSPGSILAASYDNYWLSSDGINWSSTYSIGDTLFSPTAGRTIEGYR